MVTEVTLPALGESVTEGTVTRWLKQVGDTVAVDEPLLEVSTDKVDTEIPSPVADTLLEIKAAEDETVEVGAILALIGGRGRVVRRRRVRPVRSRGRGRRGRGRRRHPGRDRGRGGCEEGAEQGGSEPEQPAAEEPGEQEQEQPAAEEQSPGVSPPGGQDHVGDAARVGRVGHRRSRHPVAQAGRRRRGRGRGALEVSTDKVDTEIPSPVAGTLLEIKAKEDETVEVGAELAVIGEQGAAPSGGGGDEQPSGEKQSEPESEQEPEPEQPAEEEAEPEQKRSPSRPTSSPRRPPHAPPAAPAAPAAPAGRDEPSGYVTPLVRKMASQHDVDLASVTGTGVGGRIRKQDVLDAASQQGTTAPPPTAAAEAAGAQPAAPAAAAAPAAPAAPAAANASTTPATLRGPREDVAAPQGHRHPDDRVAADQRPADHGG